MLPRQRASGSRRCAPPPAPAAHCPCQRDRRPRPASRRGRSATCSRSPSDRASARADAGRRPPPLVGPFEYLLDRQFRRAPPRPPFALLPLLHRCPPPSPTFSTPLPVSSTRPVS